MLFKVTLAEAAMCQIRVDNEADPNHAVDLLQLELATLIRDSIDETEIHASVIERAMSVTGTS